MTWAAWAGPFLEPPAVAWLSVAFVGDAAAGSWHEFGRLNGLRVWDWQVEPSVYLLESACEAALDQEERQGVGQERLASTFVAFAASVASVAFAAFAALLAFVVVAGSGPEPELRCSVAAYFESS